LTASITSLRGRKLERCLKELVADRQGDRSTFAAIVDDHGDHVFGVGLSGKPDEP
jgi:hypothetical protein